ncbi:aTP synthase subunit b [Ruminococcus sp. CAG:403]|jgi:F-type H+-transporting ATPase subunit b|nr:F0F1 ATP synthase subunit B [Ruminococcus sp.]CDE31390.1 aTP synthase subunit b [Ruminococcus sp. CAG:403]
MLDFSIPTILFTVINILVLFLFLKKFLFGRVNAIMEKRAQMVQADLDHAKETVAEAEQLKTNYLETMSGAQSEAKELIAKAQKIANEQRDQITQQAQRDADRIMANAKKEIVLEQQRSLESAQSAIADLAMAAASKVVGANLDDAANRDLVDAFLTEEGATE